MRKLVASLFASLLLFSSTPAVSERPPLFDQNTIVKVSCAEGSGTAFRIADGVYVTAGHVAKLRACKINGQPTSLMHLDNVRDIAELRGVSGGPVLKASCSGFTADEDYLAVGYAFGGDDQFLEPLIASPLVYGGFRAFVGEVIPGMSGGPVLGYDGKAHGVVNMRWAARSMGLDSTFVCKE